MTSAPLFHRDKALIGMVHVGALPGTPFAREPLATVVERAVIEANLLAAAGFDGLIVENMFDRPYLRREVGPEIVAGMTRVAAAVREVVGPELPLGVQVLAGANRASLAVAHASGADFIRAEGFVFAAVADEGLLDEADAGPLLRYRKTIGAERVRILADIDKKHSAHAITCDVDVAQMAEAAEFFRADGLIVTGAATGKPTSIEDLTAVKFATDLPVLVGSGATPDTLAALWRVADAIIVGSWYKRGGRWDAEPDPDRVEALLAAANRARQERA